MGQFNLKGEWLIPHRANESEAPGRTIYPEPMRMAEKWDRRAQPVRGTGEHGDRNYAAGETVVRREGDVTDEEGRAVREWLAHVEAGRIGPKR